MREGRQKGRASATSWYRVLGVLPGRLRGLGLSLLTPFVFLTLSLVELLDRSLKGTLYRFAELLLPRGWIVRAAHGSGLHE
jgi:hypothetical protein